LYFVLFDDTFAVLQVDNIDFLNVFNNAFSANWRMTASTELEKEWKIVWLTVGITSQPAWRYGGKPRETQDNMPPDRDLNFETLKHEEE
jgi:hypothetical protein